MSELKSFKLAVIRRPDEYGKPVFAALMMDESSEPMFTNTQTATTKEALALVIGKALLERIEIVGDEQANDPKAAPKAKKR
jgi:hypothetical protein